MPIPARRAGRQPMNTPRVFLLVNPLIESFVRLDRSLQTLSAYAKTWIVGLVPAPDATITWPARAASRVIRFRACRSATSRSSNNSAIARASR